MDPGSINHNEEAPVICIGIDVSKAKHDCYIVTSDGKVLKDVFTLPNNLVGFNLLFQADRI